MGLVRVNVCALLCLSFCHTSSAVPPSIPAVEVCAVSAGPVSQCSRSLTSHFSLLTSYCLLLLAGSARLLSRGGRGIRRATRPGCVCVCPRHLPVEPRARPLQAEAWRGGGSRRVRYGEVWIGGDGGRGECNKVASLIFAADRSRRAKSRRA